MVELFSMFYCKQKNNFPRCLKGDASRARGNLPRLLVTKPLEHLDRVRAGRDGREKLLKIVQISTKIGENRSILGETPSKPIEDHRKPSSETSKSSISHYFPSIFSIIGALVSAFF